MSSNPGVSLLRKLVRLYGVQTAYYDMAHCRQEAMAEVLLAVLCSLGAPVASLADVPQAWWEQQQTLWRRPLEPVSVAWDSEPCTLEVRLPANLADGVLLGHLVLEDGERHDYEWRGASFPVLRAVEIKGERYVVKQLPLPQLPYGYHQFALELVGKLAEALIISAPMKAYFPPGSREWGVFIPLYALHSRRSWGSGDYSDLLALAEFIARMGGRVVATLPFLVTFTENVVEVSPYAPASRRFWDEFYLDVASVPELKSCPAAQAIVASSEFQKEIDRLRKTPLVDYHGVMALKRRVLEELCRHFFAEPSGRREELNHFVEANPVVEDYARFRAAGERLGTNWRSWLQPQRDGVLKTGDYDEEARRYHLYVQWLTHQQVEALLAKARKRGVGLYLDLPVGVHPDSYDVWREHDLFVLDASVGAPPDPVFTRGQKWWFPPMHPEKMREQGYRYIIDYLRHHFRYAGILRIDHIMRLHRLFWIPDGFEPNQGVYVRYRPEEVYAILTLESYRNQTVLVGEDLGTVPPEVRPAMARHGMNRMYVVHYELAANSRALQSPSLNMVASLNTHDMPPFAAFWQGLDIEQWLGLGLLDKSGVESERKIRQQLKEALRHFLVREGRLNDSTLDVRSVLRACLAFLSASPARTVLINLEDLWLETQPQNIPGTREEYPNWRRKARHSLETFSQMPEVIGIMREVNALRKIPKD